MLKNKEEEENQISTKARKSIFGCNYNIFSKSACKILLNLRNILAKLGWIYHLVLKMMYTFSQILKLLKASVNGSILMRLHNFACQS